MNAEGIETYPNELNALAEADDIAGNGVFDPNDTHGNVNPDAGVFATHLSLPGYVDRDQFYKPSEVSDLTKDGKVMYVPGGAVSFQQGQPETLRENQLLWELPPSVKPFMPDPVPMDSTVNAPTAARPVSGTEENGGRNYLFMAGVFGVAAGLGYLYWKNSR